MVANILIAISRKRSCDDNLKKHFPAKNFSMEFGFGKNIKEGELNIFYVF